MNRSETVNHYSANVHINRAKMLNMAQYVCVCMHACVPTHHVCEKFTGIQTLVVSIFRFIVDRHLTPSVHLHLFQE